MSKKNLLLRYLKMLLLSLLVLITTITVLTRITILNYSFVSKQFTSKHYQLVEEQLKTKMKESMISSGLDNKIIDTMFNDKDIKKTTQETLDIVYDYNKQSLNTEKIKKKLEENINLNLQEHQYEIQDPAGYNNFVNSMMDIYESEFNMLGHVSTVGAYMQTAIKLITVIAIMLSVITVIIITYKYKKMPRYLPVALFTTSFLIFVGGIYIYYHAGLASITIISPTFSNILRKIIVNSFNVFYITAIVYIVIGIVLCFFVRRHRHHH